MLGERGRGEASVLFLYYFRLQGVAALFGGPCVASHHRDALRNLEHVGDARHGAGSDEVGFAQAPTPWRTSQLGIALARAAHVEAIAGFTARLCGAIDARHGLADIAPFATRLQRWRFGHSALPSRSGEFAVGELARRSTVLHYALHGGALADGDLPAAGSFCHEHLAGRGCGGTQRHEAGRDAGTTAGNHHRETGACISGQGGRVRYVQCRPRSLELVREQLCKAGVDALTHLHLAERERDGAIVGDTDEGAECAVTRRCGAGITKGALRQRKADN